MAFDRVAGNTGARTAGIDGRTVADVTEQTGVPGFLDDLRAQLKQGTFCPVPAQERTIPKPGSSEKVRRLGIPTVADRVVQAALKLMLEPMVEELLATLPLLDFDLRALPMPRLRELLDSLHLDARYDHHEHTADITITLAAGQGDQHGKGCSTGQLRRHDTTQCYTPWPLRLSARIRLRTRHQRECISGPGR